MPKSSNEIIFETLCKTFTEILAPEGILINFFKDGSSGVPISEFVE